MTLLLYSRALGKMIHERNLKQKSCDTVPLSNSDDIKLFFSHSMSSVT
jgi:hypothetical protein